MSLSLTNAETLRLAQAKIEVRDAMTDGALNGITPEIVAFISPSQYDTVPSPLVDYNLSVIIAALLAQARFPTILAQYPKASLPAPGANAGCLVYVTDDVGGAVPAFSDGTDWRRVTDRAIVS